MRRLLEIVAAFTAIWFNTSSLKDTIVVDVDAVASSMIEVARREKFSCTKREKKQVNRCAAFHVSEREMSLVPLVLFSH